MECVDPRLELVPLSEDLLQQLLPWGKAGMLPNCGSAGLHRRTRTVGTAGRFHSKKLTQAIYQRLRLHEDDGRPRNILKSAWRFKIRNVPNLLFDAVGCIPD